MIEQLFPQIEGGRLQLAQAGEVVAAFGVSLGSSLELGGLNFGVELLWYGGGVGVCVCVCVAASWCSTSVLKTYNLLQLVVEM